MNQCHLVSVKRNEPLRDTAVEISLQSQYRVNGRLSFMPRHDKTADCASDVRSVIMINLFMQRDI